MISRGHESMVCCFVNVDIVALAFVQTCSSTSNDWYRVLYTDVGCSTTVSSQPKMSSTVLLRAKFTLFMSVAVLFTVSIG